MAQLHITCLQCHREATLQCWCLWTLCERCFDSHERHCPFMRLHDLGGFRTEPRRVCDYDWRRRTRMSALPKERRLVE